MNEKLNDFIYTCTNIQTERAEREREKGKSMHYQEIKIGFILWRNFSEKNLFIHAYLRSCR